MHKNIFVNSILYGDIEGYDVFEGEYEPLEDLEWSVKTLDEVCAIIDKVSNKTLGIKPLKGK